jgi:hypothetical protein
MSGLIKIAEGPVVARSGTLANPASTINFGKFMKTTDDGETLNRTTVTVNTGAFLQDAYLTMGTIIAQTTTIVADYFTKEIINPGNPPSGSVAYVSGGYLHVKDSHAGHATFDAVYRIDLSDHDQTIFAGKKSSFWGEYPWGQFDWGFSHQLIANDFWLWKNTLTGPRTYTIASQGAISGSSATLWLTDDSQYSVTIMNSGSTGNVNVLFVKPQFTGSVASLVFDGTDFHLVGHKRIH